MQMLEKKELDAVCLNIVGDNRGFGNKESEFEFITKQKCIKIKKSDKFTLADEIIKLSKGLE
jgi:phosphopantothenoylcysteine decarboxylase/phosphopantothenate--cysteine ligase